jgi:hypothetical protein
MSYASEHPDWIAPRDLDLSQLEKLGFEDISYRLDDFPFFGSYQSGMTVGVDYAKHKSVHKCDNFNRYHLYKRELAEGETEHECLHDESEHILSTNSFEELLAKLKGESAQ